MRDRLSTKILSNGATRYGVYDETGNLLRYEYIKLEDEPTVEGDLFSKVNMLPDSIPALLGLKMANPQVKDALNVLANIGNVHVWERVQTYADPYTPAIPAGTTTDYLTSTDRNAYTDGTVDNTTITYLGQLGGGARIEVGSYVGTGTYGSGNKNTLTFKNKRPKKVTVVPKTHSNNSQIVSGSFPFVNGAKSAVARLYLGSYSSRNVNLSWSDDSVSWYSTESAAVQLNENSSTYFYVAEF